MYSCSRSATIKRLNIITLQTNRLELSSFFVLSQINLIFHHVVIEDKVGNIKPIIDQNKGMVKSVHFGRIWKMNKVLLFLHLIIITITQGVYCKHIYFNPVLPGGGQGCIKLVSVVSRIPDKLLKVRQMTKKITTKRWVQIS